MPLFTKALDDLAEADLVALATNNIRERKVLEYKRDLVGPKESDRKEFLYDASSFANTQGGHLIFGMEEQNQQLCPLGIEGDPGKEIVRLEEMLRDGIRPALSGVHTAAVSLSNSRNVLVMHIPKSWNPPHQVTFQKAFRIYGRNSNGKYQMDVDELRSIFEISRTIREKARTLRDERVDRIMAGQTPVALLDGGLLSLHVVPFSAFDPTPTFRLRDAAKMPGRFPTLLDNQTRQSQITVDGLLTTSNLDPPPKPQRAYTQVSRIGAVEAVMSSITRSDGYLVLPHLEAAIIRYARVYMYGLKQFGGEPPFAFFASVLGVKGKPILQDFPQQRALIVDLPSGRLTHDQYDLVESVFDDVPPDDPTTARFLRATLDHLANAAGLATSPYFDEAGNYTLHFP